MQWRRCPCYWFTHLLYCFSKGDDVSWRNCGYTQHEPRQEAYVCDACANEKGCVVCGLCWLKTWAGACFRCGTQKARQELPYGKFCKRCHGLGPTFHGEGNAACYYCSMEGQDVATHSCMYTKDCERLVPLCGQCVALKGAAVCEGVGSETGDSNVSNASRRRRGKTNSMAASAKHVMAWSRTREEERHWKQSRKNMLRK